MSAPSDIQSKRWIARGSGLLPVVVLLVCYFALGLSAASRKSAYGDEGFHLVSGLSYWMFDDYHLASESGVWAQRWIALPVWLADFRLPFQGTQWQQTTQANLAMQLLFELGNDPDRMLLLTRMMNGLLGVALGALVYLWSRSLFGALGGLISLTLYVFSPPMLAHDFIGTSDFALTFFLLASVGALWRLLHWVSLGALTVCCFAVAGALMSKSAGICLAPMALLLVAIRWTNAAPLIVALSRRRKIRGKVGKLAALCAAMAIVLLGVWLLIWASYGFRFAMFNPAVSIQKEPRTLFNGTGAINAVGKFAEERKLLPQAFLFTYSYMLERMQGGNNAFLNGEFGTRGWLGFFPYCVAVKTPLEMFLMLALAAGAWWFYRTRKVQPLSGLMRSRHALGAPRLYRLAPLFVLLCVFWAFALASRLNIGHRHVLPTYPPLFILAGAAAWWFQPLGASKFGDQKDASLVTREYKWLRVARGTIVVTLLLTAAEAFWCWPDYLAYFNLLTGGPRFGYKHLVDSSLDWGQEVKELKQWFDAHPSDVLPPQRVYLSFFGDTSLDYYGIRATRLPSFPMPWQPHVEETLHGGTYCISATQLQDVFLQRCPGRWNKRYEEAYQLLRHNVELYRQSQSDPTLRAQTKSFASPQEWNEMFELFEKLRFSRLCSFLRQREPDDEVGYSILIYRLSDADISRALDGAPVELLEKPEMKDK